jgi:O-antigen/teichoic acid export membrane protein
MNGSNLKQSLLKGGLYLILRQIITTVLSLISILVITRVLGPERYGWYIIGFSCNAFATSLATVGLKVYLIRKPGDCSKQLQGEILAFLIGSSTILSVVVVLTASIVADLTNVPELRLILIAMAPAILLDTCTGVPLGLLERNLQYKRSSLAEVGSLLLYYLASIPFVLIGWGVWGLIAAFLLQSVFQVVVAFVFHPVRPVWPKNLDLLRDALKYGVSYSTAIWVEQGRRLGVSLLLGRFVGAEAVGLLGATTRITSLLAIAQTVAWQLGFSGFAKLQEDPSAMRRSLSKAMNYQALLLTLAFGLFACLSPVLVPLVLGPKWHGIIFLFPFVALFLLFKFIFELHMLVLFAMGHNFDVLRFWLVNATVVLTALALLGGPFHIWGYIAAEMLCLPTYGLLHWSISRVIGSPDYKSAAWIAICMLPPLLLGNKFPFFLSISLLIAGFGLVCCISAEVRTIIREFVTILTQKFRAT